MYKLEDLPDVIRTNRLQKFWVQASKTDANTKRYLYNEDLDVDGNINALMNVLSKDSNSRLFLFGKQNADSQNQKNIFAFEFSTYENTPQVGNTNTGAGLYGLDDVRQMVSEQVRISKIEIENEYRKSDLERREKELAAEKREFMAEKESAIGVIVSRMGQFLKQIKPPMVAGLDAENPQNVIRKVAENLEKPSEILPTAKAEDVVTDGDDADAATAEIENKLQAWADADADWFSVFSKIVHYATTGEKINVGIMEIGYEDLKKFLK